MKTPEEIMSIIQDTMDGWDEHADDFFEYVMGCGDDLTDEEKEWASENLGMRLVVERI